MLTEYSAKIRASNRQGLGNHSKTSEEVYRGLLNRLLPSSNYKQSRKVNEKAVDLFDDVSRTAVQIKSSLTKSELRECIRKFSETSYNLEKRYDLVILLTASECSLRKGELIEEGCYGYIVEDSFYIDNHYLLSLINVDNCHVVLEYLKSKTVDFSEVLNNQTPIAGTHNGHVFNFSNTGDVSLSGASFDFSSDLRQLNIEDIDFDLNQKKILGNVQRTSLPCEEDNADSQLRRVSSYIFNKTSLYECVQSELDNIYQCLNGLEGTEHENISKIIWLVIYYESSENHMPTRQLIKQAKEHSVTANLNVSPKYESLLNRLPRYFDNSIKLLNSISYG